MKKNIKIISVSLLALIPVTSFAALAGLQSLITSMKGIVNSVIPVVFGLGIVYFFYAMGQFILHSDDDKKREDYKQQMLWGIIAIFVMASIMGIVGFIGSSLGIDTGTSAGNGGFPCPDNPSETCN